MKLKDLDTKLMKNPAYRKEVEKYDLAFEISQMLIEARIIKGITQEKLATMIRTKQSGIARAESGTVLPKISFLKKIADALHAHLIVKLDFMKEKEVVVSKDSSNSRSTHTLYTLPSSMPIAYAYQTVGGR